MDSTIPWLERRGGWFRLLLAIAAGAILTLGQAPVDLPYVFFLAVPMGIWLIDTANGWKRAALAGWGMGFGYFVTGLHWIGHAFLVDAAQFAWLLPFAVTLLPAFLALFWALAFGVAHWLWPGRGVLRILLFACALTAVEMLRSSILTGFPWSLPSYAWVETPILQSASWAGPFGLTLLVFILTGLPLTALVARQFTLSAVGLACFAGLWIWGDFRVPPDTTLADNAPLIRLVQPNAPQAEKWKSDRAQVFYRRLLEHSRTKLGETRPDVVIWPETAITYLPTEEPLGRDQIAAAAGTPVILGALDRKPREGGGEDWFNSMITIMPDGSVGSRYAKHHLVPFGEYMPFKGILSALGMRQLASHGGLSPGDGPTSTVLPGLPRFAPAICYEMIFPEQIIADGPRPAWILTITNDAWFGDFAGPQQHLAQARFRAVEQGLPVARAANTGISAIIDAHGRVVGSIPLHTDGYIDHRLPVAIQPTIYSFTDSLPTLLALLSIFAVCAIRKKYKKVN